VRTTWLGLVGDGFSGRRNYDKPADEHLPADRVGTSVDKYGKVSSIGFPWRPYCRHPYIQLRARSSVSLRSGGSILLSKAGPFLASGEGFRQDSTLHATWSRVGHAPEVPVTGQRKSVKILGAIDLWDTRFHYRQEPVFNALTYLVFLKQLAKTVSAPRSDFDSGWRLLSQERGGGELVRCES